MYIQQDNYVIDMKESVLYHKGIVQATGIECLKWKKILKGEWVKIHSIPRYPVIDDESFPISISVKPSKFFYQLEERR